MIKNFNKYSVYIVYLIFLIQLPVFYREGVMDTIEPLLIFGYATFFIIFLIHKILSDIFKMTVKMDCFFKILIILSALQLLIISVMFKSIFSIVFSSIMFIAMTLNFYLSIVKEKKQPGTEV